MFRITYHPNAFLTLKRNIQPGLLARTKMLYVIEKKVCSAKTISRETELSYKTVLYHLHLLEAENILNHKGRRPYLWQLTGVGQQKLVGGNESKRGSRRATVRT
ncbi:MAG: ArsR family transcriptional regulator [Candidatus Bathyarchaeota archaeon]|jgi:predicted ArsR family transcriptional regulator